VRLHLPLANHVPVLLVHVVRSEAVRVVDHREITKLLHEPRTTRWVKCFVELLVVYANPVLRLLVLDYKVVVRLPSRWRKGV
jgi:hypothetical protein